MLLPSARNKTLTAFAKTEPFVGAHHARARQLHWFLAASTWDAQDVNQQRLTAVRANPCTAPTTTGVLVIAETGDRKAGTKTAPVGRQYLANLGKIATGVGSVTSRWADAQISYPIAVEPSTPAHGFEAGNAAPEFRTKSQIGLALAQQACGAGLPFRAVVADRVSGEQLAFRTGLQHRKLGDVLARKPAPAWWIRSMHLVRSRLAQVRHPGTVPKNQARGLRCNVGCATSIRKQDGPETCVPAIGSGASQSSSCDHRPTQTSCSEHVGADTQCASLREWSGEDTSN